MMIENYNEIANKMNEYLVREIIYEKKSKKNFSLKCCDIKSIRTFYIIH